MESSTVLEARGRRVSRTGMARPSTRDLKLPAYLKLPRWQRLARCTERLTYLAQAYLAVRVNHLSNNWGDKVENCKLSFSQLYKLAPTSNVKADIAKVRGARGPNYVYKAESLAVELSGSSDDDN